MNYEDFDMDSAVPVEEYSEEFERSNKFTGKWEDIKSITPAIVWRTEHRVNPGKLEAYLRAPNLTPEQMQAASHLFMAHKAGVDPLTSDYKSLSRTYLGQEDADPKAVYETLGKMYTQDSNMDERFMEKESWVSHRYRNSMLAELIGEVAPTLASQPGPREDVTVTRRQVADAMSRQMTKEDVQLAHRLLVSQNPEEAADVLELMGEKRRSTFLTYVSAVNPSIVEGWWDRYGSRIGNTVKSAAEGLGTVTMRAVEKVSPITTDQERYQDAISAFPDLKMGDGTPLFTENGEFTNEEARRQFTGTGVEPYPGVGQAVLRGRDQFIRTQNLRKLTAALSDRMPVDEALATKIIQGGTAVAVDMGAMILASVATESPAGGIAYSAARFAGPAYNTLVYDYEVPEDMALVGTAIATVPYVAIDRLELGILKNVYVGGTPAFIKNFTNNALAVKGLTAIGSYGAEVGAEGLQAGIEEALTQTFRAGGIGNKELREHGIEKSLDAVVTEIQEAAMAMIVPLAGAKVAKVGARAILDSSLRGKGHWSPETEAEFREFDRWSTADDAGRAVMEQTMTPERIEKFNMARAAMDAVKGVTDTDVSKATQDFIDGDISDITKMAEEMEQDIPEVDADGKPIVPEETEAEQEAAPKAKPEKTKAQKKAEQAKKREALSEALKVKLERYAKYATPTLEPDGSVTLAGKNGYRVKFRMAPGTKDSAVLGYYDANTNTVVLSEAQEAGHELLHAFRVLGLLEDSDYAKLVSLAQAIPRFDERLRQTQETYAAQGIHLSDEMATEELVAVMINELAESGKLQSMPERSIIQRILDFFRDLGESVGWHDGSLLRQAERIAQGKPFETEPTVKRKRFPAVENLEKRGKKALEKIAEERGIEFEGMDIEQLRGAIRETEEAIPGGSVLTTDAGSVQMPTGPDVQYSLHTAKNIDKEYARLVSRLTGPAQDRAIDIQLSHQMMVSALNFLKPLVPHGVGGNPIRPNAAPQYVLSVDFVTTCVRETALATLSPLIMKWANTYKLTPSSSILAALQVLRGRGVLVPCTECYKIGAQLGAINKFSDMVNRWDQLSTTSTDHLERQMAKFRDAGVPRSQMDPLWKLTPLTDRDTAVQKIRIADVNSKGKPNRPTLREWMSGKLGSSARQAEGYSEYNGWLVKPKSSVKIQDFNGDQKMKIPQFIEWIKQFGGFRFLSNSDFQAEHAIDHWQVLADLSLLQSTAHGYTNLPDFVTLFGPSGIKQNMSIYMDETDGEIVPRKGQGMPLDTALALAEQHPDAGPNLIATSDKIMDWGFRNPAIRYILPAHLNGSVGKILKEAGWQDYGYGLEKFRDPNFDPETLPEDLKQYVYFTTAKKRKKKDGAFAEETDEEETVEEETEDAQPGKKIWHVRIPMAAYADLKNGDNLKSMWEKYKSIADRLNVTYRFEGTSIFTKERVADGSIMKAMVDFARWDTPQRPVDVTKVDVEALGEAVKKRLNDDTYTGHDGSRPLNGKDEKAVQEFLKQNAGATPADLMKAAEKERKSAGDKRYSIRPPTKTDAAYLSAVESDDMETAQRMVDEAARAAGAMSDIYDEYDENPPLRVYHGSPNKGFTVFDPSRRGSNTFSSDTFLGDMFTKDARIAKEYFAGDTGEVRAFYILGDNVKDTTAISMEDYESMLFGTPEEQSQEGYDYRQYKEEGVARKKFEEFLTHTVKGDEIIRVDDPLFEPQNPEFVSGFFIVRNRNRIKSADPVVRDDTGRIIPLSERFNPESPDIRYSIRRPQEEIEAEKEAKAVKDAAKRAWAVAMISARKLAQANGRKTDYAESVTKYNLRVSPDELKMMANAIHDVAKKEVTDATALSVKGFENAAKKAIHQRKIREAVDSAYNRGEKTEAARQALDTYRAKSLEGRRGLPDKEVEHIAEMAQKILFPEPPVNIPPPQQGASTGNAPTAPQGPRPEKQYPIPAWDAENAKRLDAVVLRVTGDMLASKGFPADKLIVNEPGEKTKYAKELVAEYRATWVNVLSELADGLTFGYAREAARKKILALKGRSVFETIQEDALDLLKDINQAAVRGTREEIISEIRDIVDVGQLKTQEAVHDKLDKTRHTLLRYIKEVMDMTSSELETERTQQLDLSQQSADPSAPIAEREKTRQLRDWSFHKLKIIGLFGGIKLRNTPISKVGEAVQYARDLKAEAKKVIEDVVAEREARLQPQVDAFVESLNTGFQEIGGVKPDRMIPLTRMQNFADIMGEAFMYGSNPELTKFVTQYNERISKATNKYRNVIMEYSDALEASMRKIWGKEWENRLIDLHAPNTANAKYSEDGVPLSRANLLQIVATMRQRWYRRLADTNPETNEPYSAAMAKRLLQAQEIEATLTPEESATLDAMVGLASKYVVEMNQLAKKLTGLEVQIDETRYFPAKMANATRGPDSLHIELGLIPNLFIPRVRHSSDLAETANLFSTLDAHMADVAKTLAFSELGQDMRGTFGTADVIQAMKRTHGDEFGVLFRQKWSDIINVDPLTGPSAESPGSSFFRAMIAMTRLGFNVSSAAVQVVTAPQMLAHMPVKDFLKVFANINFDDVAMMWDSAALKYRGKFGFNEAMQNVMKIAKNRNRKYLSKYIAAGMSIPGFGDRLGASVMGAGLYRVYRQRGDILALPEEEAHNTAMALTMDVIEKAYQSSWNKDLPSYITRGNWAEKMLGQFVTSQAQAFGHEFAIVHKAWKSRKSDPNLRYEVGRVLFTNHIIIPSIITALSVTVNELLTGEEDEDKWKKLVMGMVLGPLRGWLIFGAVVEATMNVVLYGKRKRFASVMPVEGITQIAGETTMLLHEFLLAIYETGEWEETINQSVRTAGSLAPPVKQASKVYEGYFAD